MRNAATDWSELTKQLRRSLGLKQSAFAEFIGTTQATVCRWELGVQVPEERFQRRMRATMLRGDIVRDDDLLLSMVQYSPSMMSVIDPSLRVISYSSGLASALGLLATRLRTGRVSQIFTPVTKGVFTSSISQMFRADCGLLSVSFNDRSSLVAGRYLRRSWSVIRLAGVRHLVCQDVPIAEQQARLLDLHYVTVDQFLSEMQGS